MADVQGDFMRWSGNDLIGMPVPGFGRAQLFLPRGMSPDEMADFLESAAMCIRATKNATPVNLDDL